jgi:hypothetical protein
MLVSWEKIFNRHYTSNFILKYVENSWSYKVIHFLGTAQFMLKELIHGGVPIQLLDVA